ncbi:NAD-dependent protein deacetylase sirtuin-2 [Halyomorpha halys]|uniref:NAD-dependent protein deacetylase sirtuin-2 n=1 Tax=Halyomorpha halys TaxID=286706 RepID=UPI0006D4D841|nr:NAD-dependent protein deacetylase sirtuin-2-like [Halyomorpha halys]
MDANKEIEDLLVVGSDPDESIKIKPIRLKKYKNAKGNEMLLSEPTIEGIAKYITEKPCKSIVVLSGAGVSTNSGIPDVRTPGSGLYYTIDPKSVPYPHAIFEIRTFRKNPRALYNMLYPYLNGNYKPTLCHYFITLLQKKNVLLKNYTLNADDLEKLAGVNEDKLGQVYGTFNRFSCLLCKDESSARWVKRKLDMGQTPKCDCGGIIKPKIFFYGEALPQLFCHNMAQDMKKCDLLIILGSSLSDEPIASMPFLVDKKCPRLVINGTPLSRSLDFEFNTSIAKDVFWQGDCEDGCVRLVDLLGWTNHLHAIQQDSLNRNVNRHSPI